MHQSIQYSMAILSKNDDNNYNINDANVDDHHNGCVYY